MSSDEEGVDSLGIGDLVAGKYRIVRVLGRGGMGIVYEALHLRLDRKVALKMLHRTMLASSSVVERFEREALAAAKLKGPNVADVLDVDVTDQGIPFIVMEYLEGRDLGQEIESRIMLPAEEAISCVLQACSAMAAAHKMGIVHRDLKPANLFLHTTGDGYVVKVLDFGISKMTMSEQQDMTMTRSTLGTPLYMSPEQIRSTKHVDGRTDIWALGVILFECLSGNLPFMGENPSAVIAAITADEPSSLQELCPDLPAGLCAVVSRALAKAPTQRYQTIDELALALVPFGGPNARWGKVTGSARTITSSSVAQPSRPEAISADAATLASAPEHRVPAGPVTVPAAPAQVTVAAGVPSAVGPPSTLHSRDAQGDANANLGAATAGARSAAESKITAGAWSMEGPSQRPKRTMLIAVAAAAIVGLAALLIKGGDDAQRGVSVSPAGAPPVERTVLSGAPQPTTASTPPKPVETRPAAMASASATPPVAVPSAAAPSSAVPSAEALPVGTNKPARKATVHPAPVKAAPKTEQNPMHL